MFDGPALGAPLLGRVCHGARDSFTSSSNFLSVRFVSDGSVTRSGFLADYYSRPSNHSTRTSPTPLSPASATDQSHGQVPRPDLLPDPPAGSAAGRDQGRWARGLWVPRIVGQGQTGVGGASLSVVSGQRQGRRERRRWEDARSGEDRALCGGL